jgi:hypothetical protein
VEITNEAVGGPRAYFMVDSGAFDLFVLLGPSITDVVRQYTSLTGVAHLPPVCLFLPLVWSKTNLVVLDLESGLPSVSLGLRQPTRRPDRHRRNGH